MNKMGIFVNFFYLDLIILVLYTNEYIMCASTIPAVPTLDAVTIGEIKKSGRSEPIAMQCASILNPDLVEYVVKLYGSCDLKEHSLAREVYGALLGRVFDLKTPDIAIINISPLLVDHCEDTLIKEKVLNSTGYNFGSKTLGPGIMTFLNVPGEFINEALEIFSFDMLIRNPDRRNGKPNMFQTNEGFTIYDHELAFPYSMPIMLLGNDPEPWNLRGDNIVKNHILYQFLKGKINLNFDSFTSNLSRLSDETLDMIHEQIPDNWKTNDLNIIKQYLIKARDNANLMKKGLQEALI